LPELKNQNFETRRNGGHGGREFLPLINADDSDRNRAIR
jgi:hypothetical protein